MVMRRRTRPCSLSTSTLEPFGARLRVPAGVCRGLGASAAGGGIITIWVSADVCGRSETFPVAMNCWAMVGSTGGGRTFSFGLVMAEPFQFVHQGVHLEGGR